VPIFVGAVQDGSIFLNAVKLKRLYPESFKFAIDVNDDVFTMAALQHWSRHHGSKRQAIWILGGGVPKNYTLQGEPLLDQILYVPTEGFDLDLQFCVDPVDNGALSSCPAGEGHTWGKVSADAVETGSIYCHCDVTAVFPWLVHALMQLKVTRRKPFRLMDRLGEAVAFLDADVAKRRGKLLETVEWSASELKGAPALRRATGARGRSGAGSP
jgi:deoxyhypusine synthase